MPPAPTRFAEGPDTMAPNHAAWLIRALAEFCATVPVVGNEPVAGGHANSRQTRGIDDRGGRDDLVLN